MTSAASARASIAAQVRLGRRQLRRDVPAPRAQDARQRHRGARADVERERRDPLDRHAAEDARPTRSARPIRSPRRARCDSRRAGTRWPESGRDRSGLRAAAPRTAPARRSAPRTGPGARSRPSTSGLVLRYETAPRRTTLMPRARYSCGSKPAARMLRSTSSTVARRGPSRGVVVAGTASR